MEQFVAPYGKELANPFNRLVGADSQAVGSAGQQASDSVRSRICPTGYQTGPTAWWRILEQANGGTT